MQARSLLVASLFSILTISTFADSIDDAEAKRRGIPASQVQAENALAKEKQKAAALEKQIADLQKQLSALRSQPGDTLPTAPAPVLSIAKATQDATPLNFDGPRASSPLYDDLINHYLSGDWTTLANDLAAKEKEIAALPAGNRADLTYVQQTVAECRPIWWDQAKNGKATLFRQPVWSRPVTINYKPAEAPAIVGTSSANGTLVTQLSWPAADMDSKTPMSMMYIGIETSHPNSFVIADGINYTIWMLMAGAQITQQIPQNTMTPAEKEQDKRYTFFRENLAGAYYGTPPARRLSLIHSATSHSDRDEGSVWPLSSAFLIELKIHPQRYPTIPMSIPSITAEAGQNDIEFAIADLMINHNLLNSRFTFSEDRLVREMIKSLAEANPNWKNSKIQLSNMLSIDLNPDNDAANLKERLEFLKVKMVSPNPRPMNR